MPSRALQRHPRHCGVTGGQDAATLAAVRPTSPRQVHPRANVRTTTRRGISTPPPSKPLLGGYRAHHDASSESRFARTVVHSVALSDMPSHVARTVRHACKLPPPWPIKGGAVPWPQRERALTHAHCLHHDIGTCLNQKPLGPGGPASFPASLVAPLCKHYGATQYSASSTPLLNVRPQSEPG
jgi:hypothetical protein